MPPLGLMYLAAYIEKHTDHTVKICDMNVGQGLSPFLIWDDKPDIVGITTTTLTFYDALWVAKIVKGYDKNIKVVMGGPHCSIYPQETASFPEVDYVVQGEGELPFMRILEGVKGKILEPEMIEDLDTLPMPARHLVNLDKYHGILSKRKTTSILSARACPYHCVFCHQPKGSKWRARSAESVVGEMEIIAEMGIGEIEIMDDTFSYDRDRTLSICWHIQDRGLKINWNIRTRVDKVDEGMLHLMAEAGCKRINYGVESFDNRTLKTLRKGFDSSQALNAIEMTKEAGIEVQAYLMLGSPDETEEQMKSTIRLTNTIKPDYAYFSLTSSLPGTALYEQGLREGRYADYWREYSLAPTANFTMRFWREDSRQEMIEMLEYAYKSFYFRPSYIWEQLLKVRSMSELIRKAKMAIGMAK